MVSVISQERETYPIKTFSYGPTIETITTVLTLIETSTDTFGLNYEVIYSGIKRGHVAGGPISVSGNGNWNVYDKPPVNVSIPNYSDDSATKTVSFHIEIIVDSSIPGVEKITIFDKTMGGKYGIDGISAIMAHVTTLMSHT